MNTLIIFKEFVDEINKENGRLYKQSILEKYKNDDSVKYFLNFIFNSYIITGISRKKLAKSNLTHGEAFGDLKGLCEYLKKNNTGRDEDIARINTTRKCFPENLHDIFNAIITKDLSIGVDVKTINKVIPGLIPEFNVMLANKYFEDPERIEGKEFAITTKIDGGRIVAIKENGKVTCYTRQGQVYEGLVDLEKEMETYMPDDMVLDGELTVLDKGNLTSKEQYKQTMKISRADGEKHGLKMLVFDAMYVSEFRNQSCCTPYYQRRNIISAIMEEHLCYEAHVFKYFELLPILYQGTDTKEIKKWLDYNVEHGEEGVMLNITNAAYHFDRTWDLQKVKKMQTLDLEIVDYFEGNKQFTGMLGGFVVRYKDNNLVRVGSGFTKEFRKEAWKDPKQYVGKIIEVQYFEETTNQSGGISLRFPVFVDFRTDKLESDF